MIRRSRREAIPEKIAEIPDPYNLRTGSSIVLSVKFAA